MSLDKLINKINDWSSSSRKIREDSAAQTISDFASLKARADLYADSLRVSLDDLKASIVDAQGRAQALIDSGGAPEPAKAPESKVVVPAPVSVDEDVTEEAPQLLGEFEAERLAREFKDATGRDAPAGIGLEALRELVAIVSSQAI